MSHPTYPLRFTIAIDPDGIRFVPCSLDVDQYVINFANCMEMMTQWECVQQLCVYECVCWIVYAFEGYKRTMCKYFQTIKYVGIEILMDVFAKYIIINLSACSNNGHRNAVTDILLTSIITQ